MAYLAVFAPLFAFIFAGLFGRNMGDKGAQFVTCFSVLAAAFASVFLFVTKVWMVGDHGGGAEVLHVMDWIVSGKFQSAWEIRLDTLSIVMMCVVNIVSACVHIYSIGYMSHDPHKARFMAYLSLFTFAMLMLVTSNNLLQLFFGWEGVGVASYLLIGFWHHKESANAASMKAFLVNRVGDLGLILAICLIFLTAQTIDFDRIFSSVELMQSHEAIKFGMHEIDVVTLACLLLFVGAIGKSAQLGLHTWLPDAMEGPTPVSALIHAATMVTAGVFLVARFSPLFEYAPDALAVVCIVGACTALVAATIGLTQFDIKRVIAYSTMSQLGYMFFALGVSAYGAAMFHLVTHAFFKALLFLGAGSVIHALSDEQDMRRMGGVWKKIPYTYALMWIGSLALAGVPLFAGYYSKDMILEAAWADASSIGQFAYWMGIAAAFMTAFYSWRLLFLTFHGKPRCSKDVLDHAHESPPVMMGPLVVLAIGALFSGAFFYQPFVGSAHHSEGHVEDVVAHDEEAEHFEWTKEAFWRDSIFVMPENDTVAKAHDVPSWVKYLPTGVGAVGILMAFIMYFLFPRLPFFVARVFKPFHVLFYNKWFFDVIYDRIFVRPARGLGMFFWKFGDGTIINGLGPDGLAALSQRIGGWLSKFQSGFVFQYAFVMMIGLFGLVSWFFFRMEIGG